MTDLAAIRARAEQYPEPPERAGDLDLPWLLWGAADRRTLLAEVDRLLAVAEAARNAMGYVDAGCMVPSFYAEDLTDALARLAAIGDD